MIRRSKFDLLAQYSWRERILLFLIWIYDRTIRPHRKPIDELRQLHRDLPSHFRMSKQLGDNLVTVSSDPQLGVAQVLLRRGTSDARVFRQVFLDKQYSPIAAQALRGGKIGDVRHIIDAGANIGCSTIFFKKLFPHATVICIEPESGNYERMLRNIELNELTDVRPIRGAVWSASADLELDLSFRDGREWSRAVRPNVGSANHIEGMTFTEVCKRHHLSHVDILKIDIEGAEREIFESDELQNFLPFVRHLAIEIHDDRVSDKILARLAQLGFSHFRSGELVVARNERFRA